MLLVELAIALPIVLIAFGMFVHMLSAGTALRWSATEEWAAGSAAQNVLEEMRNEDFRQLFALYNADAFDDPGGLGTAPGNRFAVPGLDALESDPQGMVGEVLLPTWNAGSEVVPLWELREDLLVEALGMPRDLNGDILLDEQDHAGDYTILPIMVRLRWRGRHGPRELRMHSMLSEFH